MMNNIIKKNRYLVLRRTLQFGLLLLFGGANWWGWKFLMGNYSSAYVLESFYLTDPHAVLQTFAAGFVMSTDAIVGGIIVLLFYGLIAGRSFCSWVCPVNILTDLATWMRKKWRLSENDNFLRINRKTRYWILGLGLILSPIVGVAAFEVINPIGMLHRGVIFGFGMGWTFVVAVFLFDLLFVEYGWCGHLCPLGAFYTLSSRFALIKVKHDAEKCTLCMKCKDVCHEIQVLDLIGEESGYIKGACSNCGRCVEVCDDDALKFSVYNYKN
ncbi:MAG: quinol dehydrogenase ferredoxin subunit NapH [Bacteroidales bacterium]|nr:quinol dehydrogenase ferredoxin subunit NapH [Bacteroidales bacterium]